MISLRIGQIAAAISGFWAELASMPTEATSAFSTTFGNISLLEQ